MNLRVTPDFVVSQTLLRAQQQSANLARLQRQLSTGLRVQRPSDDPAAIRRILSEHSTIERIDSQIGGIQSARAKLNLGVSQLLDANTILVRAKEIALEANQPLDEGSREVFAKELDNLLGRLLSIANTENDGAHIFAGSSSNVTPFTFTTNSDGNVASITYSGSDVRAQTVLGTDVALDHFYSGAEVFQQRDRQGTVFVGQTGAAPGSGTDSATARNTLVVRHTSTTFAAGSGIQAGANSVDGDTIIGAAGLHQVTIVDTSGTGAFGTISINGGPAAAFTNTDTDLKVVGNSGETIYVDTTAIAAGFNGNIAITAQGSLSVDGGETEVPIDFSTNQVITHGSTGSVTNVDSSDIIRAGVEHIEYTGTADVFQAITGLRDDLRNERGLSEADWSEAIARRIEDLDRVRDGIMQMVGEQSVALENLDALENNLNNVQLESQRVLSDLESADLADVTLRLQTEDTLLQFTFASLASIMDTNLLNFLS